MYNLSGLTSLMPDTVILKNEETFEHLFSFLDNRTSALKLCHRASLHGWSSQQFHQQCDDKVNTVVLVLVSQGWKLHLRRIH